MRENPPVVNIIQKLKLSVEGIDYALSESIITEEFQYELELSKFYINRLIERLEQKYDGNTRNE